MSKSNRVTHCLRVCNLTWNAKGERTDHPGEVLVEEVYDHSKCIECALSPEQRRVHQLNIAKKIASGDLGFPGWQYGSGLHLSTSCGSVTSWP